jgi:hypothetical protein
MVSGSEGNEDFERCGLVRRGAVTALVACLMWLAGAAAAVPRDIVVHRDGTKVEGKIIQETEEVIILHTEKYGDLHFRKMDLVKLERGVDPDATPPPVVATPSVHDYRVYIPEGPIDPERPVRPIPIAELIRRGLTPPPSQTAAATAIEAPAGTLQPGAGQASAGQAMSAQATPAAAAVVAPAPGPAAATMPAAGSAPVAVAAVPPPGGAGPVPPAEITPPAVPGAATPPPAAMAATASPAAEPMASPTVAPVAAVPAGVPMASGAIAIATPATVVEAVAETPALRGTPFVPAPVAATPVAAAPPVAPTGTALVAALVATPVATASSAAYVGGAGASAAGSVPVGNPAAGTAAGLTVVSGSGTMRHGNASETLAPAAGVGEGAALQTGPADTLVLRARGGQFVVLGPASELTILKIYSAAGVDVALTRGWMWAAAGATASDKLVTINAAGCQIAPEPADLPQGLALKVELAGNGRLMVGSLLGKVVIADSVSDSVVTVERRAPVFYVPGSRTPEDHPELLAALEKEWGVVQSAVAKTAP